MHTPFKCHLASAAVALPALLPSFVLAQPADTATALAPVTVIGNRTLQQHPDVLGDVSVIPRAVFERAGQSSLADVLARSAGLEAVSYGGPQTVTRLFLRGHNSNQVLVLLDGVRINTATNGGAALNAIALHDIERVEILRGAASSLYGADAVGGVINIITRSDADEALRVRGNVGVGSDATRKVDASIAGNTAGWRYAVSAGYAESKGFDATTPELFIHNPDRDSYYQRSVSASAAYEWRTGHEISTRIYHSRINGGYDAGMPWFNDRSVQALTGYTLGSRNVINHRWTSTLRAAYTEDKLQTFNAPGHLNPDNPPDGVSQFRNRQLQYTWQNDLKLTDNQQLTLVLERLEQRVQGDLADYSNFPLPPSFVDYPVNKRHTNSVTAIYTGKFGRHQLQASARHDNDSQYSGQSTGAIGYGYALTPRWQARIAANTAFRAPDFNERFFPGSGNPNLKPEKSRNVEAGLRYLGDATDFSVTVYRNRVENLIAGFPSVNIGHAVLQGITLEAGHQFGATSVRAIADIQNPHDRETGELLPLRAKRLLTLLADHAFTWGMVGVEWQAASQRYGSTGGRDRMSGYALTNLTASYNINPRMQVNVRWNNIFDRHYTLVPGYATGGSNVFVSLSIQH